jgi:hypothetical protein
LADSQNNLACVIFLQCQRIGLVQQHDSDFPAGFGLQLIAGLRLGFTFSKTALRGRQSLRIKDKLRLHTRRFGEIKCLNAAISTLQTGCAVA